MEEQNNKLSHQMPTWNTTKNPATNSSQQLPAPPLPNNYDKRIITTTTRASRSPKCYHKEEEDNEEEEERDTASTETRERLKRHREEVKGRVKIPEDWGQEKMMKEWIDYTTFDASLFAPHRVIVAARDALIADGRKTTSSSSAPPRSSPSQRLRIYSQ